MTENKETEHEELLRLTRENNEILRKMYRNDMILMGVRVLWYLVLIGMPFAIYFYFLEPYFEAFGANYELFRQGMGEIPGLKGLEGLLP